MPSRKPVEPTLPCRDCFLSIPEGAHLCSACGSYQHGWRRYVTLSNTALALLTALISVSALTVPIIYKAIHTPTSKAKLDQPTFDGTSLRIVAINTGDAPASLGSADIVSDVLVGASKVKLRNESSAFIQPGSQQVAFDIVPLMSSGTAYTQSMIALGKAMSKKASKPDAIIRVRLIQSDGETEEYSFPVGQVEMFDLLRAHADRCESVKEPDFVNGCIGGGDAN